MSEELREKIARIIDPKGWKWSEEHERSAEEWAEKGLPKNHALTSGNKAAAIRNRRPSLAKADAIAALFAHPAPSQSMDAVREAATSALAVLDAAEYPVIVRNLAAALQAAGEGHND